MGRLLGSHARPLTLKSVVRYSPNWVKNQNRMASTSNQETYRTDVDGRLVFDILRQVGSSSFLPHMTICTTWSGGKQSTVAPCELCSCQKMMLLDNNICTEIARLPTPVETITEFSLVATLRLTGYSRDAERRLKLCKDTPACSAHSMKHML